MRIHPQKTASQTTKPRYVYVYGERATDGKAHGKALSKGQACFAGGAGAFAAR